MLPKQTLFSLLFCPKTSIKKCSFKVVFENTSQTDLIIVSSFLPKNERQFHNSSSLPSRSHQADLSLELMDKQLTKQKPNMRQHAKNALVLEI